MPPMFVPGPVDVHPEILNAQTRPMLPHRSVEFETIFQRALESCRRLFYTHSRVFIVTSSGTGLQEACIRNLAKRDVLSCVNGAFGQRWYQVAQSNGKRADILEVEWGKPITEDIVSEAINKKQYEVITIVHNETSTGVENPVKKIAARVHSLSPETLICIDAVSSLGGTKIETDSWGLDMVLTSSQKCLALPPGLALAAVSDRAMEYAAKVPNRGWYFDLVRMDKHLKKDSTPATPAMSLIFALDEQLKRIFDEGLEARFARHSSMARRVQDWALAHGFALFAQEGYRSQTMTAITNNLGLDFHGLNAYLMSRNMRIADGYRQLKGKTFRIAHMGENQLSDINNLLSAIEEYIS
jgi:aspartate aminotransferase-like enzyme